MSSVNPELAIEREKSNALPLKGEKQPTFKIIGIMVILIAVIIVNYFFLRPSEHKQTKKSDEHFDLAYAKPDPITNANANAIVRPAETKESADVITAREMKLKLAEAKAKDFIDRLQAPQSSASGNAYATGTASAPMNQSGAIIQQSNDNNEVPFNASSGFGAARTSDPNTAFLLQASNSKAAHVYATHYGPLPYIIGQGKFIFANLAVAINSDLPGQITATVSQNVYGDQGRKILVPRGSLLIGEYKSGLVNHQSRLFVVWTRVREPNGIDVMLGSEGTDQLGRAGLTGDVDYHFFARFGSAFLIAMIGAGASTVGVNPNDQYNSAAAYRESVSEALAQQANATLDQNINIPPTINVPQGQQIVVFVNRDLDFSRAVA